MPVVSRTRLRQQLGLTKLRDTSVGSLSLNGTVNGANGLAVVVVDPKLADLSLSGQNLYAGTWIKLITEGVQYTVATFNAGSGALLTGQQIDPIDLPIAGEQYEHHRKLSPNEKDQVIDGIIGRLWTRKELPINTITGALQYSIGQGFTVFGAYLFAAPSASLDRQRMELPPGWTIAVTGSGRELRLPRGMALGASQQLILDAQVYATLGSSVDATVNIPNEDWVLDGAAARAYQLLAADAPGQEATRYEQLAQSHAAAFRKNLGKYREEISYAWRSAFDELVA